MGRMNVCLRLLEAIQGRQDGELREIGEMDTKK